MLHRGLIRTNLHCKSQFLFSHLSALSRRASTKPRPPAPTPRGAGQKPPSSSASQLSPSSRLLLSTPFRVLLFCFNSFLAAHLFTTYVFTVRLTSGPSMLPTINVDGDWVLISKLHRRGRSIQVGDIVSYKHPMRPEAFGIKRVIGLPGDFVARDTPDAGDGWLVQVPAGHCWVSGDNLPWSRDSRMFGPLPMALIRGKVMARVFPQPTWYDSKLVEDYLD